MSTQRIVYSRGFPYGAPCLYLRGGATRNPDVKDAIKAAGAIWDGHAHAWKKYAYDEEAAALLTSLRDRFDLTVDPKAEMDPSLILDLPTRQEATA